MEEDIKILEELRKELGLSADANKIKQGQALENLIKTYKELEIKLDDKKTELQILKDDIKADEIMYKDELIENYIPVSLVKEKIKELNKGIKEFKEYVADSIGEERQFYKKQLGQLVSARNELQELLEGDE